MDIFTRLHNAWNLLHHTDNMVILPGTAANTTVPTQRTSVDTGLNITELKLWTYFEFYVVILDVMGPPIVNTYPALSQYMYLSTSTNLPPSVQRAFISVESP